MHPSSRRAISEGDICNSLTAPIVCYNKGPDPNIHSSQVRADAPQAPSSQPKSANKFVFGPSGHGGRPGQKFIPRMIPDGENWQTRDSKRKAKPSKYKFVSMVSDPDTRGRAMWRDHQKHNREFALPRGFDPTNQSSLPTRHQRMDFGQLSLVTNTYIKPIAAKVHGGDRVMLKIWGAGADVDVAIKQIEHWLSQVPEECKSDWSKTRAKETEIQMRRVFRAQQRREKFRRPPKSKEVIEQVFLIGWQEREWKLEDVLGQNLEGLDSIRMDHRVYILKSQDRASGQNIIQLLVPKGGDFWNAIRRLSDIDKQIDSREYEKPQIVLFQSVSATRDTIMLKPFQRPRCILPETTMAKFGHQFLQLGETGFSPLLSGKKVKKGKLVARQKSLPPVDDAGLDEQINEPPPLEAEFPEIQQSVGSVLVGTPDYLDRNVQLIEATTICTLRMLQYFRGNLTMRLRLGTYFMDAVRRGPDKEPVKGYGLDEFESLINQRNSEESTHFNNFVSQE